MTIKVIDLNLSDEEIAHYKEHVLAAHPDLNITEIVLRPDPDDSEFIKAEYVYDKTIPFERIRRITGYLVGTIDRWNDGKRAEEKDRVKHNM